MLLARSSWRTGDDSVRRRQPRRAEGQPAGTLKVSIALAFGRDYILPLLGDFLARYPAVVPDWHFDNRQVDLVGEGFDAAIGGGIELVPGMVARELGPVHLVPVVAPAYLAGKRRPTTPADLAALDGILMRSPQTGRIHSWAMRNSANEQATVDLKPRLTVNDPDAMCRAVLLGLGVGLVPMPHALPHLESGAIVRLLPDWYADAGPISLYYAGHRLLPTKTRAFVDFVEEFRRRKLAARFAAVPGARASSRVKRRA